MMTDGIEYLASRLRFSKHALDDALLEQPDLYYRISEGYAEAKRLREMAKSEFDEGVARVKQRFATAGVKRISKAAAGSDRSLDELREQVFETSKLVDRWEGLRDACQQRSHALRDLTQLYNGNYFQRSSGARAEASDRRADEVRSRAGTLRRQRPEKS